MLFSGQVLQNSKPVKSATVEIELYNKDGIKSDFQNFKVITDEFGVFHFVSPYSGWIGFSALLEGEKIESKDSEIGAVLWINFR
jgi:cobalt/nickel transport protein